MLPRFCRNRRAQRKPAKTARDVVPKDLNEEEGGGVSALPTSRVSVHGIARACAYPPNPVSETEADRRTDGQTETDTETERDKERNDERE